jgi:hypothetical protein
VPASQAGQGMRAPTGVEWLSMDLIKSVGYRSGSTCD